MRGHNMLCLTIKPQHITDITNGRMISFKMLDFFGVRIIDVAAMFTFC